MAIEREIPKDISKYEAKFAGPFTIRNLVFGIPGAALTVGCYFLLRPFVPDDVNFFIDLIVAAPFFACGWIKPYGVPFEKYVSIAFTSTILSPKHRLYRCENAFDNLKADTKEKVRRKKRRKQKKNENYPDEFTKYK